MPVFHRYTSLLLPVAVMAALATPTVLAAVEPLSPADCKKMHKRNTITEDNPVACERLARVTFSYLGFDGKRHDDGRLVVLDVLADQVQSLFDQLLQRDFPLQQAVPLEVYRGNDKVSMRNNNTSAFNGRRVTGGTSWSIHAYGAAIDLNPLQNPFIAFQHNASGEVTGQATIEPKLSSQMHVNRLDARPGKPARPGRAEEVMDLFAEHGFLNWGGYWNFPIDYQHFEVGRRAFIQRLAQLPLAQGKAEFAAYITSWRQCMASVAGVEHAEQRALCVQKVMDESV